MCRYVNCMSVSGVLPGDMVEVNVVLLCVVIRTVCRCQVSCRVIWLRSTWSCCVSLYELYVGVRCPAG